MGGGTRVTSSRNTRKATEAGVEGVRKTVIGGETREVTREPDPWKDLGLNSEEGGKLEKI